MANVLRFRDPGSGEGWWEKKVKETRPGRAYIIWSASGRDADRTGRYW